MTQIPAITIGLMTHNYGCFLRAAIESVLAQTRTDWEMIIADDASTDDTPQIVQPYLDDPRITYVRHAANLGQAGNWGFLLAQGTAPVVAVLHADDAWLPKTLELALAEFEANPEVDLVFGNWQRCTGSQTEPVDLNKRETLTGVSFYQRQAKNFTCLVSGAFLSRHVIAGAGLPDPTLQMVVDYEYFLRVALHARIVRSLAALLLVYRVHEQSTTYQSMQNGVYSREKERMPEICARAVRDKPYLSRSVNVLRRQFGLGLFRDGCFEARRGSRQEGCALIRRGIRVWSASVRFPWRHRPAFLPTRDYLCSHVISRLPLRTLRMAAYRGLGLKIGAGTTVLMGVEMHRAADLSIGQNTVINPHCHLDGRGGLSIGSNVNLSSHVLLIAGTHDVQDGAGFQGKAEPITIEDYCWVCTRAMILAGVTVGRGAVVAAGAVVTRSVPPYTIVAGVPAQKIGERSPDLTYQLEYDVSWQ